MAAAGIEIDNDEEEDAGDAAAPPGGPDGIIDGGVANGALLSSSSPGGTEGGGNGATRKSSNDCDLVLLIECVESLDDLLPSNPIARPSVTVSVGLDKNTRLSAVFSRYCDFINENQPATQLSQIRRDTPRRGVDPSITPSIRPSDLEFLHCTLLSPAETAESSALMKNDRIRVRKSRSDQRESLLERDRLQRESDREYFAKLRSLLPERGTTGIGCGDVVTLDCRGKITDGNGLGQGVLRTGVRAHASVLRRRCKWLGRIVDCAREERERRGVLAVPSDATAAAVARGVPTIGGGGMLDARVGPAAVDRAARPEQRTIVRSDSGSPELDTAAVADDDDDGIEALPYPAGARRAGASGESGAGNGGGPTRAAEIEIDDDDEEQARPRVKTARSVSAGSSASSGLGEGSSSPLVVPSSAAPPAGAIVRDDTLWVTLPHPPEAVKLLLEYCYTNRVVPLGHDAFVQSSKSGVDPVTGKPLGPIPPYSSASVGGARGSGRGWPNDGAPTVSLPVALAGLALAEEASMPRLSLMCEIAASRLVTSSTVLEALAACTAQQKRTGNKLPRLRRAAMAHVFGRGRRGVAELTRAPTFKRGLEERRDLVVPSLLIGTMEIVPDGASSPGSSALLRGGPLAIGSGISRANGGGGGLSGRKRDMGEMTRQFFETLDQEDLFSREMERKKRRSERRAAARGGGIGVGIPADFGAGGGGDRGNNGAVIGGEDEDGCLDCNATAKMRLLNAYSALSASNTRQMRGVSGGTGGLFTVRRSEGGLGGCGTEFGRSYGSRRGAAGGVGGGTGRSGGRSRRRGSSGSGGRRSSST